MLLTNRRYEAILKLSSHAAHRCVALWVTCSDLSCNIFIVTLFSQGKTCPPCLGCPILHVHSHYETFVRPKGNLCFALKSINNAYIREMQRGCLKRCTLVNNHGTQRICGFELTFNSPADQSPGKDRNNMNRGCLCLISI